jgi:hypothetical protein
MTVLTVRKLMMLSHLDAAVVSHLFHIVNRCDAAEATPSPQSKAQDSDQHATPATGDAVPEAPTLASAAHLPAQEPAATAEQTPGLRQRGRQPATATPATPATADAEVEPDSSTPASDPMTEALLRSAQTGNVTLPAAIVAAAYQTRALRLAMACAAAVLAVSGHLQLAGVAPILQLLASNAVVTLSAAWMLTQQPERFKLIDYQMHLRSGGLIDKVLRFATSVLGRKAVTQAKALAVMAWSAYVDSGCYLTVVIVLYLLWRGERQPDLAAKVADKLRAVQESFAQAAEEGVDAVAPH